MSRLSVLGGSLALAVIATLVPGATTATTATTTATTALSSTVRTGVGPTADARRTWTPPGGVMFNDPTVLSRRRVILAHVIKAINNTRRGEQIRVATWNFDDRPATDALLRAANRRVSVQIVVSGSVDNPNFDRLRAQLKTAPRPKSGARSSARKCRGTCRYKGGIMHTKMYLFSKVGSARRVVMFGSANLTTPAGNRQWNDLVTIKGRARVYGDFVETFKELKADKRVADPYRVYRMPSDKFRTTLYPAKSQKVGPILKEFKKVECRGATGGAGNANGRTRIRIAIAGWFDEYGAEIAREVRRLWERGCDIKIVNTLTGRGINQALRDPSGRGPVPNREITIDNNGDGIPERYLHLKYFTINGVYEGNTSARVVFTGSANWSQRSLTSDELLVRARKPGWVKRYEGHVDRLYASRWAHGRPTTSEATLRGADTTGTAVDGRTASRPSLPQWFETDW